jgi:hypothetical protein
MRSRARHIAPPTSETPIGSIPDEHIALVMPSRFFLPNELGHQAYIDVRCPRAD